MLLKIYLYAKQDQHRFSLTDDEILRARHAKQFIIEKHYSEHSVRPGAPWILNGQKMVSINQLYIVQARPETVYSHARNGTDPLCITYKLN